jgi:hypothetical protein
MSLCVIQLYINYMSLYIHIDVAWSILYESKEQWDLGVLDLDLMNKILLVK